MKVRTTNNLVMHIEKERERESEKFYIKFLQYPVLVLVSAQKLALIKFNIFEDMRILKWVHNKLNGKQDKKRVITNPVSSSHYDRKEEFSDWPQALLAIGTFGTNGFKSNQQERCSSSEDEFKEDGSTLTVDSSENSESSSHELPDFTVLDDDHTTNLQKELTELLTLQPKSSKDGSNLQLNRFLNSPTSLEVLDREVDCDNDDHLSDINIEGHLSPKTKIILSKAKDILTDNRSPGIKRKLVKFLLKKLSSCRRGFPVVPNIRSTIPESKIEKILRMMLHKKIYPQSCTPSSLKKYLDKKLSEKRCEPNNEDEEADDDNDDDEEEGFKWVKTDSEFIVLEI